MARITVDQLVGNYMQRSLIRAAKAYTTSAGSRWSAVRITDSCKGWNLFHRASGTRIDSLHGRMTLNLAQAMRCVAALDALETDWRAFDALTPAHWGGMPSPGFGDNKPPLAVVHAMRDAIKAAL